MTEPTHTTATVMPLPRLNLRMLTPEDRDALWTITGDERVMEHYVDLASGATAWSLAETEAFIATNAASWDRNGYGVWAVEHNDTGELIGYCGLVLEDWLPLPPPAPVGLSCRVDPKWWGRHVASEAITVTAQFAFKILNLPRVVASIASTNKRALEGMDRKGVPVLFDELEYTNPHTGRTARFRVYVMDNPLRREGTA